MDTKEKIATYLEQHRYLTLATASVDGTPKAATVSYASEGTDIYFSTGVTTAKFKNILENPHVALAVDEDYDDWATIQGVQLEGVAKILEKDEEKAYALKLLTCKFPQIAHMPPSINMRLLKVEPSVAYFLDNSQGFGHREKTTMP
ncbi:MAG: pyridoxamine 5'-phosphate oxidase family protein [Candidatus Methanofastidiosa archaeon]|nr:pyridoxamine 5'-phosphate oxidase family protein [Candidatus Methanofastidiosa archaeon]